MNRNQPTTYIDLNETDNDTLEAVESDNSSGTLTAAYADLGKAFYEYRFEEPTPELLLYFDRITELLKTTKEAKRQREEHLEPMAAKTASKGDYKIDSSSSLNPKDSRKKAHSAKTNLEIPKSLESGFWENTQDIMGNQKTFVMPESKKEYPTPPSQYERAKRGPVAPFRKKEQDRVSSFDDLPSIEKGNSNFSYTPDLDSPSSQSVLACPVCGQPVGPSDGFCGHCGTRLH